ncbi:MAG: phosphate ABC transporter permease PstA [Clostridiales bacterium]|nr:phosphate ABC transporter permease PstA [Clostridiales bacterium]
MSGKAKAESIVLRTLVYLAAAVTITALAAIIVYILIKGIPALSWDMFSLKYTAENCSLLPALINTVVVTALSLVIAVPLGIFSAIYLVEYARRGSRLVSAVRLTAETLSGIPSIVYGLFGYLLFVNFLGFGYSLLAGALTLSIMILPVIMRTSEEALMSVPDSYREGSFGLGAGKLRTVFRIVLPSAVPGIMSGVILSIGRIVGETAALIFTAGSVAQIPRNLLGSGRTLSVHLYALWNEGLDTEKSYATAVVLLLIVVAINAMSAKLAREIQKG